jgi:hypothetical protein
LQDEIYNLYGIHSPKQPVLRMRNATQTSIVLEWDPIELATSTLRSLTLYRNNGKAGTIPNPTSHTSTKISGLAVDTEYEFHLVLRTSAGTYSSDKVTVRTQKMTDLSGITVCPGVMPAETRELLEAALQRIGAKPLQDAVRIDTTHFICTEGRGQGWEKAQDMNIPVVRPEWIEACEREGRIVVARYFYLGADMSKIRNSLPPRPSPQSPVPSTSTPASSPLPGSRFSPAVENGSDSANEGAADEVKAPEPEEPARAVSPNTPESHHRAPDGQVEHDEAAIKEEGTTEEAEQKGDENFVSVQL